MSKRVRQQRIFTTAILFRNKRLTVVGLIGLGSMISHVNFEIWRIRTNFQRKPAFTCTSSVKPNVVNPYKTASRPRGNFSSSNPTKILSHLRIWPRRACHCQNLNVYQGMAPLSGPLSQSEFIPRCSALFPRVPGNFSCTGCVTALDSAAPISVTKDLGIQNNCCHSTSYLG